MNNNYHTTLPESISSDAVEYIELLSKLHELIDSGKGEEITSDDLRDKMDLPWSRLEPREIEIVNAISSDFYEHYESDWPKKRKPSHKEIKRIQKVKNSLIEKKWINLLEGLRKTRHLFERSDVAYFRSRACQALGAVNAAVTFMEDAVENSQNNGAFIYSLIHMYLATGNNEPAGKLAEEIWLRKSEHSIKALVGAADVYFKLAQDREKDLGNADFAKPANMLSYIIEDRDIDFVKETASVKVQALIELGFCMEHMKNLSEAEDLYVRAIAIDPTNESALTAFGILLYGDKTDAAVSHFQLAADAGSSTIWPYFYLSHYAVMESNYEKALVYIAEAVQKEASPSIRAMLFEWNAICLVETKGRSSTVSDLFKQALILDPFCDRIKRNFDAYENYLSNSKRVWTSVSKMNAHELGMAQYYYIPSAAAA